MARRVIILLGACAGTLSVATLSIGEPPAANPPRLLPPAIIQAGLSQSSNSAGKPGRDLSQFPPLTQQLYLSAQRGSEWLYRVHQPTGRFLAGWDPALNQPTDADDFVPQAAAAVALARAAQFFSNEAYAARAGQAILTLLAETGPDPRDPTSRCTTMPSSVVNKLSAAGMLLAAIHAMPNPPADLLDQGEQLARFIVRQQRADGSLMCSELPDAANDFESTQLAPGGRLTGLMRSQLLRPATWKLDAARRAVAYYRPWWGGHRSVAFAGTMIPAFADAFLQTQDRARDIAFAEFACELADWLCHQQYQTLDARHPLWRGGFPDSANVQPATAAPTIASTACAGALIEAARVTRQLPDADRYGRYREAAVLTLQFAATLQYSDANTQHFAPAYRQRYLLGGFHTAHADGALQLDGTQRAVAAMVAYLSGILDL